MQIKCVCVCVCMSASTCLVLIDKTRETKKTTVFKNRKMIRVLSLKQIVRIQTPCDHVRKMMQMMLMMSKVAKKICQCKVISQKLRLKKSDLAEKK